MPICTSVALSVLKDILKTYKVIKKNTNVSPTYVSKHFKLEASATFT